MDFSTARVLVTGGSSGIGAAIAQRLKGAGARVVICGRDQKRLNDAAHALGVEGVLADVSKEADVIRLFETTDQRLGGLDVLINNAGYGYFEPLHELDEAAFRAVLQTNVVGAAMCGREAAKRFQAQQAGNIVNVASTAALNGFRHGTAYAATKFALRGMTECWRAELRPYNVRVMLINPSEVMTDFAANVHTNAGKRGEKTYTQNEQATKLRGQEIADAVYGMLALDGRGFVTEATIFATNPQV